jgi:ribosomal protein S27AE
MNKHIEEMAKAIFKTGEAIEGIDLVYASLHGADADSETKFMRIARHLYRNGYRKSTDGEWVDRYKGQFANPIYVCSVCGKGTLLTPHINELGQMEMVQAFSHFCPNCGAKMKYESEGAE